MLDFVRFKMASSNIVTTRVFKLRKGSYINILQIMYKEEIRQSADKEYGGRYLLNLQCRSKIILMNTLNTSHTLCFFSWR